MPRKIMERACTNGTEKVSPRLKWQERSVESLDREFTKCRDVFSFFRSFLLSFFFIFIFIFIFLPSLRRWHSFLSASRSLVLIERTRRRFERYKSSLRALRPLKGYRPGGIIQRIDGITRSNAKGSVRAIPIIASNAYLLAM